MASTKISQLAEMVVWASGDQLVLVDVSAGDNKVANLNSFFANVPTSIATSGDLDVTGNTALNGSLTIVGSTNVTSNNATVQFGTPPAEGHDGKIFWDANYIYVATSNTDIKRAALASFT